MSTTYGILIKNGVNYSHDTASSISFDNTESGITATNTQDAIDELISMIPAGSGGHTIKDDGGTNLTQRDNLQFKGVYTEDDSTNGITKVDICRTMTKAQMESLSGESLKGFINTSDEPDSLPLTAEWVAYDSNTSVKDKLDKKVDLGINLSNAEIYGGQADTALRLRGYKSDGSNTLAILYEDRIKMLTYSSAGAQISERELYYLYPANTIIKTYGLVEKYGSLTFFPFCPLPNPNKYTIECHSQSQMGVGGRTANFNTQVFNFELAPNGFWFYSGNSDVSGWFTDDYYAFYFTITPI